MRTDLTPTQKPRGRTKTFDYDKTLDIAIQRYWSKGPTQVSVNEICRSAGVSKPSLYREFKNEDGLMAASLERYAEKVLSHVLGLLDQDQGFKKVLDSLISYSLRPPAEGSPAGCLFAKMRLDKDFLGPETKQVIEALQETTTRAFAEWLRKAKDDQGLVLPGSVHTSAAYIGDQLNHLANRSASNGNLEELREQAEIAFAGFKSG